MPSRALLVVNEFGELLIDCSSSPFSLLGCDSTGGRSIAGVAWRALQQAAGKSCARNPLRGPGTQVCINRVEHHFVTLLVSQDVAAVRLGDEAVRVGRCQWVAFTLLEDVPMAWALQRVLQVYGQRFKLRLQHMSKSEHDSSATDDGSFSSTARAAGVQVGFEAAEAEADEAALRLRAAASRLRPRDKESNHHRLLLRSTELRCRAARVGAVSCKTAAAAAAWAARRSALAAASACHGVDESVVELQRRLTSRREQRQLLHHDGAEAEDEAHGDWVDKEMADIMDLSATLVSARALASAASRLQLDQSKAGLTPEFHAGGPHDPRHRAAWRALDPEPRTMRIIEDGIRWPFCSERGRRAIRTRVVPNHASATATSIPEGCVETVPPAVWISQVLAELCVTGVVRRVQRQEVTLCCALSMALKGSGKYRLCLDLRPLNVHLRRLRLRMETLRRIRHMFRRHDFLLTVDIVSAYHNFVVHPEHQRYCGFSWGGEFFVYCALSFGSSAAPAIFQGLMNAIARHLRRQGVRCGTYIDDWVFMFDSFDAASGFASELVELFQGLGLVVNVQKSVLSPTQRLQVLGMMVDTNAFTFTVPPKRVLAAERALSALQQAGRRREPVQARALAKAVGRLISMGLAVGRSARRMTRSCYRDLASATGTPPDASRWALKAAWNVSLVLSPEALSEVDFWLAAVSPDVDSASFLWLASLRGSSIAEPGGGTEIGPAELATVMASDASDKMMGGWMQAAGSPDGQRLLARERLGGAVGHLSSTWRELTGFELVCRTFVGAGLVVNSTVIALLDNQSAALAIEFGSKKKPLHDIVVRIWSFLGRHGIDVDAAWMRRNRAGVKVCDFVGKRDDDQAWQLDPGIFAEIDADLAFGGQHGHTVDMFSDNSNNQLPTFWSRWWCRGTAGKDAFAQDWRLHNGFANPPFVLIPRVVAEARRRKAALTLVTADDSSAVYWPLVRGGAPGVIAVRSWPARRANYLVDGRPLLRLPRHGIRVVRLDFR